MSTVNLWRSEDIFGVFVYSHIYSLTSVKMERESFVFYRSFYNCLKNLTVENRDTLSMAIFDYALNWEEPELDWILQSMFDLIRPQLDANNRRYENWCKGGQYWAKGWRPPKTWDNSQKPQNNPKETPSKPQDNPKLTPNDNDNVNVNENVNDNEKGSGEKRETNMLDADASRKPVGKSRAVEKENEVETLKAKLIERQIDEQVIQKIIEFDDVKKWTKIRKYKDPQLNAFITTLNTRFTNEDKISMLNTCIWNGYQWIYKNNRAKPIEKPRVSWNLFH